jgi:site-specific DNA-methyltransferase (adenine-specific)
MKYTIYYVKTDYGGTEEFTMETLEKFICEYYKKLKDGGTMIMFFDLWKITALKELIIQVQTNDYLRNRILNL